MAPPKFRGYGPTGQGNPPKKQGFFSGWLRNRTGTGKRNRRNLFFRNRNIGTGTAGTVFQEPKPEPEPCLSVKPVLKQKNPFSKTNRRNRKLEPLEPSHSRTVTEPNRTGTTLQQGFLSLPRTPKIPGREKRSKKQGHPRKEKRQGIPPKQRKNRVDLIERSSAYFSRFFRRGKT